MRNLKRALSLTLASVMLLGMMVVGGSAAEGYPDVDESQNVEAIEVLQAVGVMGGDNNGNFNPDDYVTREQMAVIMSQLLKLDYNYYKGTNPFSDVPEWAAPYVAACAANGITAGIGDGLYGSKQNIQAVQAALMMLKALGYFQYAGDYEGGYVLATVKQATEVGLFKGIDSESNADLTRNQIAQMVLNTLQADMVRFTGDPGITYTGSNGESWVGGYKAEYTPRTSTDPKYDRLIDNKHSSNIDYSGQYYIQLGEELYDGKLTKKFVRDDFERPSYNWQFDGKEIGTYVDYTLKVAEYTKGVTGETVYDKLTYTTINDNALLNYVDGVAGSVVKNDLVRSNKSNIAGSGTGVLTEIFVDRDREEVTITSINTYLAKANSDYNETNETVSLRVFMTRASNAGTTKLVDSDDVPAAADVVKDEYMLVYMSGKESASNTLEVVRIFDADILTDTTVTKFSKDSNKVVDSLTADGTSYSTNVKAFYNYGKVLDDYDKGLLTDMSYNLYLDRYGNVIGVDLYEGTKNYVFITGYDRIQSNISIKTAQAAGIFLDGEMETLTVNVTNTNKNIAALNGENANYEEWTNHGADGGLRNLNRWYTYTKNDSGVYTLKPTDMMYTDYKIDDEYILDSARLYLDDSRPAATKNTPNQGDLGYTKMSRIYGNDDSIYITVEPGRVDTSETSNDAITEVNGVYTGIQNVKLELTPSSNGSIQETSSDVAGRTGTYVYSVFDDSDGYVIASIVLGEAQGSANNYAYILGEAKSERRENDTYYWEFDAVVDGVKTTLTAKTNVPWKASGLEPFHVQELRYDGEYVTSIRDIRADKVHTDPALRISDSESIYDVGHVLAADAGGKKTHTHTASVSDFYALSPRRLSGDISFNGRTLYVERGTTDVGLAIGRDCKAVLVQYENGKSSPTVTNFEDLNGAVSRVADADDETAGIQFRGRIVAGLNNGTAEWVVLISDTELRSGASSGYDDDGDEITLPSWTDLSVVSEVGGAYVTTQGRYDKTAGKLYLQFSTNIPAGASNITLKDVFVQDEYGTGRLYKIENLKVQKNGTSYVAEVNYTATVNTDGATRNKITVTAQTADVTVNKWYVSYDTTGAAYENMTAEVANAANAEFTFTVKKPDGAATYAIADNSSTNITAVTPGTIGQSNLTADQAYTVKMTAANIRPVVKLTTTLSTYGVTAKILPGAVGEGISSATLSAESVNVSSGSNAQFGLTVLANGGVTATNQLEVKYDVVTSAGRTPATKTVTCTTANPIVIAAGTDIQAASVSTPTSIEITSVKLQSKVKFADVTTSTASNLAANATVAVKTAADAAVTADTTFVNVGDKLTVTITLTTQANVNFTVGGVTKNGQNAVSDGNGKYELVFDYTVAIGSGTADIVTAANG